MDIDMNMDGHHMHMHMHMHMHIDTFVSIAYAGFAWWNEKPCCTAGCIKCDAFRGIRSQMPRFFSFSLRVVIVVACRCG